MYTASKYAIEASFEYCNLKFKTDNVLTLWRDSKCAQYRNTDYIRVPKQMYVSMYIAMKLYTGVQRSQVKIITNFDTHSTDTSANLNRTVYGTYFFEHFDNGTSNSHFLFTEKINPLVQDINIITNLALKSLLNNFFKVATNIRISLSVLFT